MPNITLESGTSRDIPTPARYLNIIDADGLFFIENPKLGRVIGQVPRQYDLVDFSEVTFENESDNPINITYENAPIIITGVGGGSVSVSNAITVREIQSFPQLSLNASIESIGVSSSNFYNELPLTLIPPNSRRQIIGPREAVGRSITLQVQSDEKTTLRVAGANTVNANSGIILRGSIDLPASYIIRNESAIHVFNASGTEAKLAVIEEYQA